MGRSFLPRFLVWLLGEAFLHFALALPGLLALRALTLGRWPATPRRGSRRSEAWYRASLAAGGALWALAACGAYLLMS